jgi:hypothetical protein
MACFRPSAFASVYQARPHDVRLFEQRGHQGIFRSHPSLLPIYTRMVLETLYLIGCNADDLLSNALNRRQRSRDVSVAVAEADGTDSWIFNMARLRTLLTNHPVRGVRRLLASSTTMLVEPIHKSEHASLRSPRQIGVVDILQSEASCLS